MLFGLLYILDTASFEWRPEQERTLSQVRVALQSARMVVLNDSADQMVLDVPMVERILFSL